MDCRCAMGTHQDFYYFCDNRVIIFACGPTINQFVGHLYADLKSNFILVSVFNESEGDCRALIKLNICYAHKDDCFAANRE